MSKAFPVLNPDQVGKSWYREFDSIEKAKASTSEEKCDTAFFDVEVTYVYSKTLGWEPPKEKEKIEEKSNQTGEIIIKGLNEKDIKFSTKEIEK